MINEWFLIYLAGYIDGDGCVYAGTTIQKPKNILVYELSVQICSTKKVILDRFKQSYGGFVIKKPDRLRHKSSYVWIIKGHTSGKIVRDFIPFLVQKREECSIYLDLLDTIHHNCGVSISNEVHETRMNLIKNIREEKHMKNLVTKEEVDRINTLQKTVTPAELDFPYLAGLIDSEGCFRIKKWKPKKKPNVVYNITLEIGNTKFPLVQWLVERFGGSVCFIPAKTRKKAAAVWTLSAVSLYEILHKIFPYLCGKRDVCAKLIEFQKTILPNGGDRHSELFRALFEKRVEIRRRIIQEVHELNKKGS